MESLIGTRRRRSAVKTIMSATTANMPMSRLTRRPASRVLRSDILESYRGSERRATVIDPKLPLAIGSFTVADKSMRRRLCSHQVIFVGFGRINYVACGRSNKIAVERDCPGRHDWKRQSTWPMEHDVMHG